MKADKELKIAGIFECIFFLLTRYYEDYVIWVDGIYIITNGLLDGTLKINI